ncbi:MAG: Cupin 2, conserved barrel domain protein [Bryobacterales bacterium]|jgi:quercetin dioxygenase-like cupin family protein|nr:Cupin 2, conserved barrel domain protein [Bryobacterales bacterium]
MDHYNWNEITEEPLTPLLSRKVLHTPQMTIARLWMKKGAVVPTHHHVNEQVTNVESGSLKFIFPEKTVMVNAGESLRIAPNLPHSVETLEDSVALDLFTPPRADWISGDDAYLRR